jgi:hypothetical protein
MDTFSIQLPITFDLDEALDYYHTLTQKFQHLKWSMPLSGQVTGDDQFSESIVGWAIQTPRKVYEPHCMLYDTQIQGRELHKETPCAFGFAEKLLNRFPFAFRMYLTVNAPGVIVEPHVDNENIPRKIYKIIIPIQTNDKAIWTTDDGIVHLDAGNVYLVDTLKTHGTENYGGNDRVHFMFEIFEEDFELVKNMSGHI